MEKEFVSYEQAVALKELGFDEKCLKLWKNITLFTLLVNPEEFKRVVSDLFTPAPLKSQVFRWFREKYQFHPEIVVQLGFKHWNAHILPSGEWLKRPTPTGFNTYEEAENACIDRLIELAKQKDNE